MIRPFFAFGMLVAFSAGGCTFAAQLNGTSIATGDARGGRILRVTTFTQAGALNMANAWCGQYNLVAEEIRVVFVIDGMDFACVPPPA